MNQTRLLLLGLSLTPVIAAAQLYNRVEITGRIREHGERFELAIRCSPYSPAIGHGITHFWGGDSPGFRPTTVVSDLRFMLGKRAMSIPRAAFSDLGDTDIPSGPWLAESGEIHVLLHGGDAAGGYTCNFYFRNGRLVRREVFGYLAKTPSEVKHFE